MRRPFRHHHLVQLFQNYEGSSAPLDYFLAQYFRQNKAIGSKDRKEIADAAYALVRWQGLLDHLLDTTPSWENRYLAWIDGALEQKEKIAQLPRHIQVSFPQFLYERLVSLYGSQEADQICLNSNQAAPVTVRINALKATREDWIEQWTESGDVKPCLQSKYGVNFLKRENFFIREDFKQGFFEVQDEGSQLVASLVEVKGGDQVLDYCAGSGGKTLGFAPLMQRSGQIYLHDVRAHALSEAKKRLKRAGIENAQFCLPNADKLKRLKKKMDWVLVDVPCSGSGTLRRNPDMKGKIDEAMIERLIGQQRSIFEKGLSFLKPKGTIVYATCSILDEENERQVEHFLKTYPLEVKKSFKSLPVAGGMDGFFAVQLAYKA